MCLFRLKLVTIRESRRESHTTRRRLRGISVKVRKRYPNGTVPLVNKCTTRGDNQTFAKVLYLIQNKQKHRGPGSCKGEFVTLELFEK